MRVLRARRKAESGRHVTESDARLARIEALLEELVASLVHNVDKRHVTGRDALERHVTESDAGEGAPAPTRVRARLTAPSGPSEPYVIPRSDVTAVDTGRILEALRTAPAPPSAPALADALDLPAGAVLGALVDLTRAGLVRRLAGETARDRDRWSAIRAESPSETIRCSDYRAHQISGHRRDPSTGRFRCYVCEPELVATV
jgi:hypothetical protein